MAIFAILAAAGITNFNSERADIDRSTRQLTADLRFSRARAMATGDHFVIHATSSSSYQIERYEWASSAWKLKKIVRVYDLPSHLSVSITDNRIEFDSRGEMVFSDGNTPGPSEPTMKDSKFSVSRKVKVWPSGQIRTVQS